MSNEFFENFFEKIPGTQANKNKKADDQMTFHQEKSSKYRSEYLDSRKEANFKGHINEARYGYGPGEETILREAVHRTAKVYFKGESDGHEIEGSFGFHLCEGRWGNPSEDFPASLIVDGKELSPEAALVFAQKNGKMIQKKSREDGHVEEIPRDIKKGVAKHEAFKKLEEERLTTEIAEKENNEKLMLEKKEKQAKGKSELEEALR